MYQVLLPLHSLVRWLVLIALLLAIFRAYRGKVTMREFSSLDNGIMLISVKIVQLQFCIGVALYVLSPVVKYFLHHFKDAVHFREIRFFGMEHITMMVIAVAMITIGSNKVTKSIDSQYKYKVMLIWFSIGLLIILTSIPWSFSPLTSRPSFRPF
jgi:uncharacterized membrane protein YbjE (DUF340 family)